MKWRISGLIGLIACSLTAWAQQPQGYSYANLLNAAAATATASTGSPVRLSTFGTFGTIYVTFASITGSPVGCTLQIKNADSLGNLINNGSALSVSPANGTTTQSFTGSANLQTAAQLSVTYACGTYPTAGTITVDYAPSLSVALLSTGNTVTLSLPTAILAGQQAVTASAVALATNTLTKGIVVQAKSTNAISVYVGPTGVTTSTGLELPPGASVTFQVTNSNAVFVVASATGATVTWAGN